MCNFGTPGFEIVNFTGGRWVSFIEVNVSSSSFIIETSLTFILLFLILIYVDYSDRLIQPELNFDTDVKSTQYPFILRVKA